MNSHVTIAMLSCLITGLSGCASNMNLSESIIFADQSPDDYGRMHVITGGGLSLEDTPGLNQYGKNQYIPDSVMNTTFFEFTPGFGFGAGVANASFGAALSAQFWRLGVDMTFIPVRPVYLTSNVTTTGSFGFFLNSRISRTVAMGPFYRKDRRDPGPRSIFLGTYPGVVSPFYTESVGLRGSIMQASGGSQMNLYYFGAGYVPRVKAVMLFLGMNRSGPF